jgi:response regulator NasT
MTTSVGTRVERGLRVLVADESIADLHALASVLEGLGHEVTPFAVSVEEAVEIVGREDPDLAFVMVNHDDEHALALISETVECASGPVIAVLRGSDIEFVAQAAERGISSFASSPTPEALQGAIEVAIRRYRETAELTRKVDQLQTALDRRTLIERAKGILMERHGIDDERAFRLLRDHARAHRRRVVDVAAAVAEGHALLPPR